MHIEVLLVIMYHTSVAEVEVGTVCVFVICYIGLILNNVNYTSNSVVAITDIGTGGAAA